MVDDDKPATPPDDDGDGDYLRRKSIIARHYRPDDPVFNPEDYE